MQPVGQIGICQTPISQTPISFCTNCDVLHMDSGDFLIHMKEPAEAPDLTSQASQFLWVCLKMLGIFPIIAI